MKFSAWYGITVGLIMIVQWSVSILTGDVPEIQSAPWAIAFHITAEALTGLALIVGGIAALKSLAWGETTLLVALGMVIYTEVVSPGYFAQRGQWAFVAMFAVVLLGAVISVMLLLREKIKSHPH